MELRDLIGNNLVSLLNFNNRTNIVDSCNVPWQTDGGGVVCNEDQKFSDNVFKSTGSSKPLYTT